MNQDRKHARIGKVVIAVVIRIGNSYARTSQGTIGVIEACSEHDTIRQLSVTDNGETYINQRPPSHFNGWCRFRQISLVLRRPDTVGVRALAGKPPVGKSPSENSERILDALFPAASPAGIHVT